MSEAVIPNMQAQVRRYKQQNRDEECEQCGKRLRFHSLREYIVCVKAWYAAQERVALDKQVRAALAAFYTSDPSTGFSQCVGCRMMLPTHMIEQHVIGCDRCDTLKG